MGYAVKFHIVPDEFFIPFDFILGSEYFVNAKVYLFDKNLTEGDKSINFEQNN